MLGALVAAGVWGWMMRPSSEPCSSLTYRIEDRDEHLYLSVSELDALLQAEDIYPLGRPIDRVSLYRIERAVRHHPMVRTAECYSTPRHQVYVRLSQRAPLLRVRTGAEHYLIDTDRRQMQARPSVKDSVLLVTGSIGPQVASTRMADFAEWIQADRYWSARISHIHLSNPRMVVLYVKGLDAKVIMGELNGYEHKLKKLRTFLENRPEAISSRHYDELDLRFRGQVIGRTNQL